MVKELGVGCYEALEYKPRDLSTQMPIYIHTMKLQLKPTISILEKEEKRVAGHTTVERNNVADATYIG